MRILQQKISVDTNTILPRMLVQLELEYIDKVEAIVSMAGTIYSDDRKVFGCFREHSQGGDMDYTLDVLGNLNTGNGDLNTKRCWVRLESVLDKAVIDYIENRRDVDHEKSVRLSFDWVIKYLEVRKTYDNEYFGVLDMKTKCYSFHEVIKQSVWLNEFTTALGIGSFIIVELKKPNDRQVPGFWSELYKGLSDELIEMEVCLRSGDWQKAMLVARNFYEHLKIGDNRSGNIAFDERFRELMANDLHNEQGVKDLLDAIWKFFEFLSKYAHVKNKRGEVVPRPIATKEDAYFAYALALSLLNLIGRKLENEGNSRIN